MLVILVCKERFCAYQPVTSGTNPRKADSEESDAKNSPMRVDSQQRASMKHRKGKKRTATTYAAGQLSDGITADAADNNNIPVVRRVSRESKTLATQTGAVNTSAAINRNVKHSPEPCN